MRCLPGIQSGIGLLLATLLAAPAFADESALQSVYQAFVRLYEAGDYEKAEEAARMVVEYTEEDHGADSSLLGNPLINLATTQLELGKHADAASNFQRCITIIENNDGVFAESLLDPLIGLGIALRASERYEESMAALQRAKFITHRNLGIMNLEQLRSIDELTETLMASHEFAAADREQRFALRVNERRFGEHDAEVIPAIYRLATWFRRTGQYLAARDLYKRALGILEGSYGENDLRLVEPLIGIAQTYNLQNNRRSEGEKALRRAVEIYEQAEFSDSADHAQALIALGDWYLLGGKSDRAMEAYSDAWQVLVTEDGGQEERAQRLLGAPTRLRYVPPAAELPDLPEETEDGEQAVRYVDVEFTVLSDGRVARAEVVSGDAPNRVKRVVRQAVASARYRPRFVDGQAVDTERVRLRQTYYE